MMLSEIVADVVNTLRRPDMVNFVTTRVRQQIKTLHAMDNWPRDLVEHKVTVSNPDFFVRTVLPPRFRKFDLILPVDENNMVRGLKTDHIGQVGFQERNPSKVMGFQNQLARDYYYVAGDVLNIAMDFPWPYLQISYYAYPDLTSGNATTWITEFYPELVMYRCMSVCHKMLGNTEQGNTFETLFAEALDVFKLDAAYAGA